MWPPWCSEKAALPPYFPVFSTPFLVFLKLGNVARFPVFGKTE